MNNIKELSILILVLSLVSIVAIPFAGIWSINTLFSTSIPFNIQTWIASIFLIGLLKAICRND